MLIYNRIGFLTMRHAIVGEKKTVLGFMIKKIKDGEILATDLNDNINFSIKPESIRKHYDVLFCNKETEIRKLLN